MENNKKITRVIGALFIITTLSTSIGAILLEPIPESVDYITIISANENIMIFGAFMVLINALAVAAIAIVIYPNLKKYSEILAQGYIGARILESVLFCIYVIFTLSLLVLSQDFIASGSSDNLDYHMLGSVVIAASNWSYLLGLGLAFAISAIILNFVLFRSQIIPRWLSCWGFIGAILVLVNYFIESYGFNPIEILFLPIAIQEMVFAVWLIIKGFNYSNLKTKTV